MEGTRILVEKPVFVDKNPKVEYAVIRNHTFASGQDGWDGSWVRWSADSTNQVATVDPTGSSEQISTTFPALQLNQHYILSVEISNYVSGNLIVIVNGTTAVHSISAGNGVFEFPFIVDGSYGAVEQLTFRANPGVELSISNISIRTDPRFTKLLSGYWSYEPVGYLDVYDRVPVPLTYQSNNIYDLNVRNTSFSKTIVLPATGNNKRILGHLDATNIDGTKFDPKRKVRATILQDSISVFEGFLQVLSTKYVDGNNDTAREFEIRVFEEKKNVFDWFSKRSLKELDYSQYNHTLEIESLIANWYSGNSHTKEWHYPLYHSVDGKYPLNRIYPAFYVKGLLDRSFNQAGYTYEIEDRLEDEFNRLIIPYTGGIPAKSEEQLNRYIVSASNVSDLSYNTVSPVDTNVGYNWYRPIPLPTEHTDPAELFCGTTGVFTAPSAGQYQVAFSGFVRMSITITPSLGATYVPQVPGNVIAFISVNNSLDTINGDVFDINTAIYEGTTIYDHWFTFNDTLTLNQGDEISFALKTKMPRYTGIVIGVSTFNAYPTLVTTLSGGTATLHIQALEGDIEEHDLVRMNNYLPDITQKDLIVDLMKMYNLQVESSKDKRHLRFITRDSYYSAGTVYDWSDLLDRDSEVQIIPLNEINGKRLIYTYQDEDDHWNDAYKQFNDGKLYGEQVVDLDNDFYQEDQTLELGTFAPTPLIRNENGISPVYVTGLESADPTGKPRILYVNDADTTLNDQLPSGITFLTRIDQGPDYFEYGIDPDFYFPCLHLGNNVPSDNQVDLNFGAIGKSLLRNELEFTDANLYNRFYARFNAQMQDGHMLIGYFNLGRKEINEIKDNLNAKIWVRNNYYTIHKIADYDANNESLTKVELVLFEDKLWVHTHNKKLTAGVGTSPTFPEVPPDDYQQEGNGVGLVAGVRNILNNYNNLTVGDYNKIYGQKNIVLGNNNIIPKGVSGSTIFGNNISIDRPDTTYFYSTGTTISESASTFHWNTTINMTGITTPNLVVSGLTVNGVQVEPTPSGETHDMLYHSGGTWVARDMGIRVADGENDWHKFGHSSNTVTAIAGKPSGVLLGSTNTVYDASYGSIVGGYGNSLYSGVSSSIVNGYSNILSGCDYSTLVCGFLNKIYGKKNVSLSPRSNIIVGGLANTIHTRGGILNDTLGIINSQTCIIDRASDTSNQVINLTIVGSSNCSINALSGSNTFNSGIYGSTLSINNNASYSTIFGGRELELSASTTYKSNAVYSTLIGGYQNGLYNSRSATILGGERNDLVIADYGAIIGGQYNFITGSSHSTIIGSNLSLLRLSDESAIIAGENSYVQNSDFSIVLAGISNRIENTDYSAILAGALNTAHTSHFSVVLGGGNNYITDTFYASNIGGQFNTIFSGKNSSTLGGVLNSLYNTTGCTIAGGQYNEISNLQGSAIIAANAITATTDYTLYTDNIDIQNVLDLKPISTTPTAKEGRLFYSAGTGLFICTGSTASDWKLL